MPGKAAPGTGADPGGPKRKPWETPCPPAEPEETSAAGGRLAAHASSSGSLCHKASETDPLLTKKSAGTTTDLVGLRSWLLELQRIYGYRLLIILFAIYHVLKGFALDFSDKAIPYLYRAYHVQGPRMQVYQGVAQLPWAMKPVIGLVSDALPLFGLKKAPYVCAASLLGVMGYLSVGISTEYLLPVTGAVLCIFCRNLQMATCGLLAEARYAEEIRAHPESGPDLLTYIWSGMQIGGLLAAAASGFAIMYLGPQGVMLVCIVPAAFVLLPTAVGFFEEPRISEEARREQWRQFREQPAVPVLCMIMAGAIAVVFFCGITSGSPVVNSIAALAASSVVLASCSLLLSPVIAKFNIYAFVQTSCRLSTAGAAFYFFTDSQAQYPGSHGHPGGPHFSKLFYNSGIGTVGSICSLVGIITYKKYMSSWTYRSLLTTTNLASASLHLVDLLLFSRLNVRLGIPDEAFVLSAVVFEVIIEKWMWMPHTILLSHMCPKGLEASMYALLAGCHNLGVAVAANLGALLLDRLGCTPTGAKSESAAFDNLWIASAVSTLMPALSIMALFWLIPDLKQTETILNDDDGSGTQGSLWRRWRDRAPQAPLAPAEA